MNKQQIDHNALLLQVMAHDLLAPLTATKWQIELLGKAYKDTEKRERYLKGMADSTELGIALTRHAHVAGKVLSRSYKGDVEQQRLSKIIKAVVSDLKLQYERHALVLEEGIDLENDGDRDVDVELTRLFVWSIAKFFLTCVPPQTVVRMDGFIAPDSSDKGYVFMVTAKGVPNAEECAQLVLDTEPKGDLDQTYVFAKLLHEIVSLLNVSLVPSHEPDTFTLTVTF